MIRVVSSNLYFVFLSLVHFIFTFHLTLTMACEEDIIYPLYRWGTWGPASIAAWNLPKGHKASQDQMQGWLWHISPGSQEPYLTEPLLPAELTVAISISCPEPHRSLAGATCSASPHQPIIIWQRVLTASGGLLATRHPTEPLYLWTLPEEAGLMEGGVSQQALLMRVIAPTWGEGEEERKWNQPAQPLLGLFPVPHLGHWLWLHCPFLELLTLCWSADRDKKRSWILELEC